MTAKGRHTQLKAGHDKEAGKVVLKKKTQLPTTSKDKIRMTHPNKSCHLYMPINFFFQNTLPNNFGIEHQKL